MADLLQAQEGGAFSQNRWGEEVKGNGQFIFFQTQCLCDGYPEDRSFPLSVACCFGGSGPAGSRGGGELHHQRAGGSRGPLRPGQSRDQRPLALPKASVSE